MHYFLCSQVNLIFADMKKKLRTSVVNLIFTKYPQLSIKITDFTRDSIKNSRTLPAIDHIYIQTNYTKI